MKVLPISLFVFAFFMLQNLAAQISDFWFADLHPKNVATFGSVVLPASDGFFARADFQKNEAAENDFWQKIEAAMAQKSSSKNDLLIYVHGFNGSREPYFTRTLQQMERDFVQNPNCSIAGILAIKWNSVKIGYQKTATEGMADLADEAARVFENLIVLKTHLPKNGRLLFLGNSMAARLFESAFSKIETPEGPSLFAEAVFAAADFEADLFEKSLVFQQKLPVLATRSTFLFNQKDRTLAFAQLLRRQKMVGRSGPFALQKTPPNIFFEEVTGVKSETFAAAVSQHLYFSQSRAVVERLLKIWRREAI